jgi:hypothetical protein
MNIVEWTITFNSCIIIDVKREKIILCNYTIIVYHLTAEGRNSHINLKYIMISRGIADLGNFATSYRLQFYIVHRCICQYYPVFCF